MTNDIGMEETITFHVIDNNTAEEADIEEIARTEEWAKLLMSMDMEGFALEEDGTLMLVDECGQFAYCPEGRFSIRFNGTPEQIKKHDDAVRAEAVKDGLEALRAIDAWWRLPNEKRTIEAIESAMRLVVDVLNSTNTNV